jgi:hypothetical protein
VRDASDDETIERFENPYKNLNIKRRLTDGPGRQQSRDTAIRISSVPRFRRNKSFVKIPSRDKVMGLAKYFCRPF